MPFNTPAIHESLDNFSKEVESIAYERIAMIDPQLAIKMIIIAGRLHFISRELAEDLTERRKNVPYLKAV